ncbi:MAG: hypothetical protein BWZ10_03153 [candidate division BRC1 bacterium ADurb.BinA364]|nr:MAG: hypothetical protein BWZ10_03153 [candidate division BRC1 bacterium ADurb.BinA364]
MALIVPRAFEPGALAIPGGEQVVARIAGAVAALDQHCARPKRQNDASGAFGVRATGDSHTAQRFSFVRVGSQDIRLRDQGLAQSLHCVFSQKAIAARSDHYRIDHQWKARLARRERFRDRFDDGGGGEHAGFGGAGRDVAQNGPNLIADKVRRNIENAGNAARVLSGQGRDGAHSIHAEGGEGLQIGLNAGAAAGVGSGHAKSDWIHRSTRRG